MANVNFRGMFAAFLFIFIILYIVLMEEDKQYLTVYPETLRDNAPIVPQATKDYNVEDGAFAFLALGSQANQLNCPAAIESLVRIAGWAGDVYLITDQARCYDEKMIVKNAGMDPQRLHVKIVDVDFGSGGFDMQHKDLATRRDRIRSKGMKTRLFDFVDDPRIQQVAFVDCDVLFGIEGCAQDMLNAGPPWHPTREIKGKEGGEVGEREEEDVHIKFCRMGRAEDGLGQISRLHTGCFVAHRQNSKETLARWGAQVESMQYDMDFKAYMAAYREAAPSPEQVPRQFRTGPRAARNASTTSSLSRHSSSGPSTPFPSSLSSSFLGDTNITTTAGAATRGGEGNPSPRASKSAPSREKERGNTVASRWSARSKSSTSSSSSSAAEGVGAGFGAGVNSRGKSSGGSAREPGSATVDLSPKQRAQVVGGGAGDEVAGRDRNRRGLSEEHKMVSCDTSTVSTNPSYYTDLEPHADLDLDIDLHMDSGVNPFVTTTAERENKRDEYEHGFDYEKDYEGGGENEGEDSGEETGPGKQGRGSETEKGGERVGGRASNGGRNRILLNVFKNKDPVGGGGGVVSRAGAAGDPEDNERELEDEREIVQNRNKGIFSFPEEAARAEQAQRWRRTVNVMEPDRLECPPESTSNACQFGDFERFLEFDARFPHGRVYCVNHISKARCGEFGRRRVQDYIARFGLRTYGATVHLPPAVSVPEPELAPASVSASGTSMNERNDGEVRIAGDGDRDGDAAQRGTGAAEGSRRAEALQGRRVGVMDRSAGRQLRKHIAGMELSAKGARYGAPKYQYCVHDYLMPMLYGWFPFSALPFCPKLERYL